MPFRIFKNTGSGSWQPSSDGVTDGQTVRFHAIGSGGNGSAGDTVVQAGGGGGGGERRSADVVITTATDSYAWQVDAGGNGNVTTFADPMLSYILVSNCGNNALANVGGGGGTGGTGALIGYSGGTGGDAGADSGGGGAGGAKDGAAGQNGTNGSGTTGGAGGATGTQFGQAGLGGGGDGANTTLSGANATEYGGGGGGGSILGNGGSGAQGIIVAAWGSDLANYPAYPFVDGYLPGSSTGTPGAWWLFF